MRAKWDHFSHGADLGIRGYGSTREEAFANAALALAAAMADPTLVQRQEKVAIVTDLRASDDALLLYDWLNAVVYMASVKGMLFGEFLVEKGDDGGIDGWAYGEPVNEGTHSLAVEVKGATMTALRAEWSGSGVYIAQCVVDV